MKRKFVLSSLPLNSTQIFNEIGWEGIHNKFIKRLEANIIVNV